MANNIDFGEMVQQMRDAGVRILTDKSDLALEEAYVILGSKSSVRYLQGESDGINGLAVICAEDEVDMNRLCSALNKPYYDTDDEKRPYKVPFEIEELQKVINILKMNSLNIANADRTVNKPRSSSSKDNVRTGTMSWIVSANSWFDTVRAFEELRTLDWFQGKYKLMEGDIVYIYLGRPAQKIRLKCKVTKANMPCTEIDDRKYVIDITDEELEEEYEPVYENTMQLTVLAEYEESDLFSAATLAEHGVVGTIRTPRTVTGATLEYFKSIDVPENIKISFEE